MLSHIMMNIQLILSNQHIDIDDKINEKIHWARHTMINKQLKYIKMINNIQVTCNRIKFEQMGGKII